MISGGTSTGKSTAANFFKEHLPNSICISGDNVLRTILGTLFLEIDGSPPSGIPEILKNNNKIKALTENITAQETHRLLLPFKPNKASVEDIGYYFLCGLITISNASEPAFNAVSEFLPKLLPIMDELLQDKIASAEADYVIFDWLSAESLEAFKNADYKIAIIADGEKREKAGYIRRYPNAFGFDGEKLRLEKTNRKIMDKLFSGLPQKASFDYSIVMRYDDSFSTEIINLIERIKSNGFTHRSFPSPHNR